MISNAYSEGPDRVQLKGGDLGSLVKQMDFKKSDISTMVDNLKKSGKISGKEAESAKKLLKTYSNKDVQNLKQKGANHLEQQRNPSSEKSKSNSVGDLKMTAEQKKLLNSFKLPQ